MAINLRGLGDPIPLDEQFNHCLVLYCSSGHYFNSPNTGKQKIGQAKRQTGKETDRQGDRQAKRQTGKEIDREIKLDVFMTNGASINYISK